MLSNNSIKILVRKAADLPAGRQNDNAHQHNGNLN